MSEETLTAADATPAERAAWEVAIQRGLAITRADLRALLIAAATASCDNRPSEGWAMLSSQWGKGAGE